MELTHILVVSDLKRSVAWYRDVLGATLTGEYGGTSAVSHSMTIRVPDCPRRL